MTTYLLIAAHVEPDELHYPTTEEREQHFRDRPGVDIRPAPPKLLGLFDTQASAERYVLEAQAAGDQDFFGDGCFAVVPAEAFSTISEITQGWI